MGPDILFGYMPDSEDTHRHFCIQLNWKGYQIKKEILLKKLD